MSRLKELLESKGIEYNYINEYKSGNIRVILNGKATLYTKDGELIHNNFTNVDWLYNYDNGNVKVELNDKFTLYDKFGNEIKE